MTSIVFPIKSAHTQHRNEYAIPIAFMLRARRLVGRSSFARYNDWIMPAVFATGGLCLLAVLTRGVYLTQIWAERMSQ